MRTLEKEGKTIDEAIWRGLQELNLPREGVRIEILDEGSKGLFGIGGRPAKVLLIELEVEEELDIKGFMRSSEMIPRTRNTAKPQGRSGSQKRSPEETRGASGRRNQPHTTPGRDDALPGDETMPREMRSTSFQGSSPVPMQDDIARKIAQQLQERSQATMSPGRRSREQRPHDHTGSSYHTASVPVPQQLEIPTEGAAADLYNFLSSLFTAMQLPVSLSVQHTDNGLQAAIYGDGQDLGLLIGKHGATLDSLQYIASLALNRSTSERLRIQIQIGDYRQRRAETLSRLAERTAAKVVRDGYPQALEPMPASERRLIHMTLQEHDHVETLSEGEEPKRYVVVKLKELT
ncbi:MAG: Jag N-terminal domain-containing protein [Symbiobacteriaceae bacterium]|nr:Jag N-terminal domain-containing protein [Symbiobacteriaceae bacterium]